MALCPSCPTSEMVQAIVLDDRFWTNILAVALPVVVLALIAALAVGLNLRSPEA